MRPLIPLVILTVLLPTSASAQAPLPPDAPVEMIVARTLELYGGIPAIERLRGFQQEGRVVSPARGHGVVRRSLALPDRLRVETVFMGGAGETRVLAGEMGWRNGQAVTGPPYQAMVLQAARLAVPRLLLEGRERLVDRGQVERDDGAVRLFELPMREGMTLEIEIEESTGYVRRTRSLAGGIVFETRYDDFRRVGGILFPFVEETSAMGRSAGRMEFESIVLADDLPPELFRP